MSWILVSSNAASGDGASAARLSTVAKAHHLRRTLSDRFPDSRGVLPLLCSIPGGNGRGAVQMRRFCRNSGNVRRHRDRVGLVLCKSAYTLVELRKAGVKMTEYPAAAIQTSDNGLPVHTRGA